MSDNTFMLPARVCSSNSRSAVINRCCSSAATRAPSSTCGAQGLVRKRKMLPSLIASIAVCRSALPVSIMRIASGANSRTLRRVWMPSIPPIRMSQSTTAGISLPSPRRTTASSPLVAVFIVNRSRNWRRIAARRLGSSSMMRIASFMRRLLGRGSPRLRFDGQPEATGIGSVQDGARRRRVREQRKGRTEGAGQMHVGERAARLIPAVGRMQLVEDGLDHHLRKAPEPEQIGPDLGMAGAERGALCRLETEFDDFVQGGPVALGIGIEEDERTDICEQACAIRLRLCRLAGTILPGEKLGQGAESMAMRVQLLELLRLCRTILGPAEDAVRQRQGPNRFQAEQSDRLTDLGYAGIHREIRGIGDLEQAGRHGDIFGDDRGDGFARDIVPAHGLRDPQIELRRGRQIVQTRNELTEPRVAQDPMQASGTIHQGDDRIRVAGLGQILVGRADRAEEARISSVAGQDDPLRAGRAPLDFGQELGAIEPGHAHVRNHDIEASCRKQGQGRLRIGEEHHVPVVALGAEQPLQPLQQVQIVIDEEYALPHKSPGPVRTSQGVLASATSPNGRRTTKVAPPASASSRKSFPPCLFRTTSRQIDKPWPVPRPTSLVVKNGSKIRSRIGLGTPGPLSPTRISTKGPASRVAIRIVPRPADLEESIAWAALTIRFSST